MPHAVWLTPTITLCRSLSSSSLSLKSKCSSKTFLSWPTKRKWKIIFKRDRRRLFSLLCFLLVAFYNQKSQNSMCSNKRAKYLGLDSSEIKISLQRPPSILENAIYHINVVDQWNVPYNSRLIKLCGLDYDEGQRVGLVLRSSGVKIYSCPTRGNQTSLLYFFFLITYWKSICLINCRTPELSDRLIYTKKETTYGEAAAIGVTSWLCLQ